MIIKVWKKKFKIKFLRPRIKCLISFVFNTKENLSVAQSDYFLVGNRDLSIWRLFNYFNIYSDIFFFSFSYVFLSLSLHRHHISFDHFLFLCLSSWNGLILNRNGIFGISLNKGYITLSVKLSNLIILLIQWNCLVF